ncbi:hypothetical protein C8Q70DRAFT_760482 [Cubamyces menziesii]|nr:hypothetical protein C8Q70DRAFT_760482 [Cubamyces menziesii]
MLARRARRAHLALLVHPMRPFHSLAYDFPVPSHDAQPTIRACTCNITFSRWSLTSGLLTPPLSSIVSHSGPLVRFFWFPVVFPPHFPGTAHTHLHRREKSASRSPCRAGWQRIARVVVVWRRRCVMYNMVPMLRRRRRRRIK